MSDVSDDECSRLSLKRPLDNHVKQYCDKKQHVYADNANGPAYLSDTDEELEPETKSGAHNFTKFDVRKNSDSVTMVELVSIDKFVVLLAACEAFPQLEAVQFTMSKDGVQLRAQRSDVYLQCFFNSNHFNNYHVTKTSTVFIAKNEVVEMKKHLNNNMTMVKLGIDREARIVIHAKKEYKTGGEADCKLSVETIEYPNTIETYNPEYGWHVNICPSRFAENLSYIGNNLDVEMSLNDKGIRMVGLSELNTGKKTIGTDYEDALPPEYKGFNCTGKFDPVKFKPVTAAKTLDSKLRVSFNSDADKSNKTPSIGFTYYLDTYEKRSYCKYYIACQQ